MSDALTEAIEEMSARQLRFTAWCAADLLESIYEEALCIELRLRGILVERQVEVDVVYKGHTIKGQRIGMLVGGEVVVELKSVANLPEVATAQVLSYLKATGLKRGLLINFGKPRLVDGIKRLSL